MNKRAAKDAIKKIAKREGKSESEIREEMEKAIMIGFMNEETRDKWDSLFGSGRMPSPEELIMKMAEVVA
ncbi:MAG: hypothetical protein NC489_25200 [Ruminococcus flavefaciens]|nr:hypothetical protein [Ruminococcus flavefaciens]